MNNKAVSSVSDFVTNFCEEADRRLAAAESNNTQCKKGQLSAYLAEAFNIEVPFASYLLGAFLKECGLESGRGRGATIGLPKPKVKKKKHIETVKVTDAAASCEDMYADPASAEEVASDEDMSDEAPTTSRMTAE